MGTLIYDTRIRVDFDDRVLAHLQLAMTSKLRRGESFTLNWRDDQAVGDGRTSIWVHPAISIVFKYHGSRSPTVNPRWVEALVASGSSASGMHISPEPEEGP